MADMTRGEGVFEPGKEFTVSDLMASFDMSGYE